MTNTPPAMSSKAYQPHSSPYLLTPMEDLFSDVDEDDGQPHHHVVDVQHAPTHAAHTPIPSRSDLYGARRAQTSSATTRKNIIHSPTPPPTTSSVVVPASSSSSSSSVDAHVLIAREAVEQRLEATEELFDARVRAIDETFAHAGKHIVDRDDLIHVLQKQVADLHAQLRRAASAQPSQAHAAPNAHRWTRMTNKTSPTTTTTTTTTTRDVVVNAPAPLSSSPRHVAHDDDDDVDSLHQRVRFSRSTPPLRSSRTKMEVIGASSTSRKHHHRDDVVGDDDADATHNNSNNNKSSKQTIELLTQQLRDSERRRRRDKKSMTQHIHKLQNTYQEQLQQLHDDAERVAQQRAERQRGDASLEHLRGEAEAHALSLQMELDDQRTQHTTLMAHMRAENTQLRERVASMEMSLVRLLRLMSAVPSLKKMLSWNEIDASFVFVGYSPTNNIHDDDDDDDDVHVRANTTGLVDGVYGGTTSATDTKNIWLNNNTNNMNVLHGLVDEVSAITRARRMKLQRHECAAQLPSGEDVLACRQRERDYWVPRAAFDVAQVFRDTSCRDVPMSDFYNFLLALNRVWGDRVRERVDVLRREVKELKQKHIISAAARDAEEEKMKMMMQQQQQQHHHHGQAATLIDVDADGIRAELDELRSIVRTTISSRRTLALIRRYDHLLRRACGWKRTTDAVATQQQQQQQHVHIDAMMYDNIIRPAHLRTHDERRGSMLGATASKARTTQRHVAACSDDDEDAEWIDDDDDDDDNEYQQQQQQHHHHRRRRRPRHRDARNTQQAESSVEALLCIVEHTCERVRVVSGDFDEQLRAGCDRLRHLTEHISQLLRTAHNNNNNTVGGSSNTSGVATTEMGARVAPLQQEISALLRQKYSTRAAPTPTPTSSTYADEVLLVCGEVLHVISALVHESAEAEEAIRLVAEDAMVEAEHIG